MKENAIMAICPLFNFQIFEVQGGSYTEKETGEHFNMLRKRIEEGIEVLDNVKIRRIKEKELNHIKKSAFVGVLNEHFPWLNDRTTVIEVSRACVSERWERDEEVELTIYKIILAMRLYKARDVFCNVFWYGKKARSRCNINT